METVNINDYQNFVRNMSETEKENLGDELSACWLFAYYIHKKFNLPINNNECVYENKIEIHEITLDKNGLYSFFFEHESEFHHFILYVNSEYDLTLLSTYGDTDQGNPIITKKYLKSDFIAKFTELFESSNIRDYKKLFGIKKISFSDLNLDWYDLSYSFIPL